nr:integrase, catalytic region, zinc finger, CCHC-type, peptidase aspartic, catalytic [Tanacetum cinerariifolium]
MKDVFEKLEAEVAQYAIDRKHDAIERKNLLIANDNLISKCLSKEVFYVATNYELNVARFTEMIVAHTTVEARCLELEAELAKLRNTSHHDNQEELINRFSKLETADSQITKLTEQVTNLQAPNNLFRAENDKIKQHYKELYASIKITRAKHIEQVTALTTENVNLKAQTLENVKSISKDQVKPKVLARGKHAIDVEPIVPCLRNNRDAHLDFLRHLKESVETICDIVEEAKVVVQIAFWYLDLGCSKHMTGDRSRLMNFVKKFIEIVRFGNDYFGAIMGYGDYMIDTMADININAPAGQATAMVPPIRTDDQILPRIKWVPIGKSNCYLDLEKSQSNPIYKITVDLLKHTNFFMAFTASSTIPSIYIQQFWDMVQYDKKAGCYRCQLDEQWFVLTKDTLREALQITYVNNNQAFIPPPSSNALINFVNELGYPKIWEEFTQSIHTFVEDERNLSRHTSGKKKATLIVIPSIQFTKLIIHHLQRRHRFHPRPNYPLYLPNEEPILGYLKFSAKGTKREVFGMPILGNLITAHIQEASYYQEYLAKVAQHRWYLAGETGRDRDFPSPKPAKPARKPKSTATKAPPRPSVSTPVTSAQPVPTSAPAKPHEKKLKQSTETSDKPPKAKKSKYGFIGKKRTLKFVAASVAEDADLQKALEESLKSVYDVPRGPLPPVVIREPESGKYEPLPEVPGKGKAKVTDEQVSHDLLSLQKPKKKSPTDQYIFQRRTSTPIGSSGHDEPSYVELGQSESEEFEKVVPGADEGGHSEGQAGPDPDTQAEGQTGSDTGAQDEGQAGSNPDENYEGQAGPDPGNTGADVQSIPSHVVHDGLDREHMDLDVADVSPQPSTEQLDEGFTATAYPKIQEYLKLIVEEHVHQQFKATAAETTTITTTTLPPPPAQQQSTAEAMMMKRIDSHGSCLYTLEQLDIPHQVSKDVSEVVTQAVDWAMQAPLRNRFRDLPEADMKEILHQCMWETESYKSHEDHMQLYEALEKSMNRDQSEELAQDLVEARKKKKKSRESPKMPPGYPPHQPPPPPPPAGPSRASRAPGASGSSQVPPPPPPPSSTTQKNLEMDEDIGRDEQAPSSNDEDIGSALIPKVNLRQDWWKPFEEELPATPEPAWSIRSSDVPVLMNNWASALASNYSPPPKDSLLAQTSDIATFMGWFCKRRGITELKPQDLEGPAFEIVKVFHPDVIHLQYQMEECHKRLTDSVNDLILRYNVSKPLPLGGPPSQVTIQSDFFFNKDLEYLRYGSKGRRPALSISKIKVAYYPNIGLEQMVPDQQRFYIDRHTSEGDRSAARTHMRILSIVRIEFFSMYGYDYMKKIVLRHADLNEHVIVERDFKYLYPSDFEDLYLLNLQGHLNHLPPKDKKILTTAVNQWTRHLVIRQHVEDFQLGLESYQTQLNLTKPQWDATGFEYKHDYTVIDSPMAVMFRDKYEDQQDESRVKYEVLDQEGRRSEQGVHVRHSEAIEDKEDLP